MGGKTFVKPCTIDEGNYVKFSSFLCSWVGDKFGGKSSWNLWLVSGELFFFEN